MIYVCCVYYGTHCKYCMRSCDVCAFVFYGLCAWCGVLDGAAGLVSRWCPAFLVSPQGLSMGNQCTGCACIVVDVQCGLCACLLARLVAALPALERCTLRKEAARGAGSVSRFHVIIGTPVFRSAGSRGRLFPPSLARCSTT